MDLTTKAKATKTKITKRDCIQLKGFCTAKGPPNKTNGRGQVPILSVTRG